MIYKAGGIDAEADQTWGTYLRSVLGSAACPLSSCTSSCACSSTSGRRIVPQMSHSQSFNTAASFVTNTNWQSYSGENALGYVVQMAGLAVQNFASAAVGIAVAIALVRGFTRNRTDRLGNFWVDLTRICFRVLLPISIVFAIVFVGAGMIENLHHYATVNTISGGTQTLPGGPIASQEAIKELGTNGGGPFNANSSHPWENPTTWTNWLRDLPVAGHRLRAAANIRRDNRRQAPGPRDRCGDGVAGAGNRRPPAGLADGTSRHRPDRDRRIWRRGPNRDSGCRIRRSSRPVRH